ncbi:hypothetical protein [Motilibacter aurantiacus]|uniref:hypothetical protein n=1 Tax=Motilibacter aurantiacus TaxID=2714955 RepID=UPI00140BF0E3|nr:hypothetical protein [Motilibacter aurantiacus]NHC44980.1 hypothetical protein [Motilibacter aurantiacus]
MERLICLRCGASWPSERPVAACPVCALEVTHGDANAGGSPGPGEDDALVRDEGA